MHGGPPRAYFPETTTRPSKKYTSPPNLVERVITHVGRGFISSTCQTPVNQAMVSTPLPDLSISTDATGSKGYGAIYNNEWFSGAWLLSQQPRGRTYKELFPIVSACHLWGSRWSRKRIKSMCDNECVVAVITSGDV